MTEKQIFPFVQIEGQEDIKLAIILNLICSNPWRKRNRKVYNCERNRGADAKTGRKP